MRSFPRGRRRFPGRDLLERLGSAVPADTFVQAEAFNLVTPEQLAATNPVVLDLGCGAGTSRSWFISKKHDVRWIGMDIADSAEVSQRDGTSSCFITFDGATIPLRDKSVDLVFSRQVFMHVENPRNLLSEIARVLRPGGAFVGSVSQLEPYQSSSFWNYNPHGWKIMLESAGLRVEVLRPGIDGLTLIVRRGLGLNLFNRWFIRTSPLNRLIKLRGRLLRLPPQEINATALLFCGQYSFCARPNNSGPR